MKLLRTIQLDPSDTFVFERAAAPGEWAVSGAFAFWHEDVSALMGKARSAFRGGFLGVQSLGWSMLVQVVDASEQDRAAVIDMLAEAVPRMSLMQLHWGGGTDRPRNRRSRSCARLYRGQIRP